MGLEPVIKRRLLGALFLVAAIAMLIAGQTILQGRLSPGGFLLYWLVCFVFTCVAIVIAFRDMRDLQKRVQREHRVLLDDTLKTIESEARQKKNARRRNGRN